MSGLDPEARHDGALLSATLKGVRKHRGISKTDTAEGMNMPIRTYNRFESGETRLNLDYIHRFARVTRSDPQAILDAVRIGSPEYAVRACDNQLSTVMTVGLQNLNTNLGDKVARLDSRSVVAAAIAFFAKLEQAARGEDPEHAWLRQGVDELNTRRPKPGR